jgi:hypothetical protein
MGTTGETHWIDSIIQDIAIVEYINCSILCNIS